MIKISNSKWFAFFFFLILFSKFSFAEQRSSVTQYGITWHFDGSYECGQFITGDWWVVGPVTVTHTDPEQIPGQNGTVLNVTPGKYHGWDDRAASGVYDESLRVTFPITINGISSLSTTMSATIDCMDSQEREGYINRFGKCALTHTKSFAVLTVVEDAVPEGTFRPSYMGREHKELINIADVDLNVLPHLPVLSTPVDMDLLIQKISRPWLDCYNSWATQYNYAADNGYGYGRYISETISDCAVALMQDIPELEQLAILMIQKGIDIYQGVLNGAKWPADGGHASGRKWPVLFAGKVLNHKGMLNIGVDYPAGTNTFGEDCQTYYLPDGQPWWGVRHCSDPSRDDEALTSYRICCTSTTWGAQMLSALMLGLREEWNHEAYFDYIDRWVDVEGRGFSGTKGYAQELWDAYRNNLPPEIPYNESTSPVSVTGVSVSPTTLTLDEGQTSDLTETISPTNATNETVTWTSNDTSVATVNSSGLVSAIAAGSATIMVTTNDGGYTANCAVTVKDVPLPTAGEYYCDPENGSMSNNGSLGSPWASLEAVFAAGKKFIEGDVIYLMSGHHGTPVITGANTDYVTIAAAAGGQPTLSSVSFESASYWKLNNLVISPSTAPSFVKDELVTIDLNSNYNIIDSCEIYSEQKPWSTIAEWSSKACNGFGVEGHHNTFSNISLRNIYFGFRLTEKATYTTIKNTLIENIGADGIQAQANYNVFENNIIRNCYDIDNNHDDGIQMYSKDENGTVGAGNIVGVVVRNNVIMSSTDPNQPLQGVFQGIGCFDGLYTDWAVENNLIVTNTWHGISLYGAVNCTVVNNTVIAPDGTSPSETWIKLTAHKNGTPATGNIISNNLTNDMACDAGAGIIGNNIEVRFADYTSYFADYADLDFSLTSVSPAIDAGTANNAPSVDILGTSRPIGSAFDVGCYEYSSAIINVTGVTVEPTSLTLELGKSSGLTETVSPANATNKSVIWSSNNIAVASVDDNGQVTAITEGSATITVTTNDGSFTDQCMITVTSPIVTGSVTREYWTNISGNIIPDLTGNANYPDNPTGIDELTSLEAVDWEDSTITSGLDDNYGQRIRGYLIPEITGEYTFWIASDSCSDLYISTDKDPANMSRIAYVEGSTPQYGWDKYSTQKSASISLVAGEAYYVEILHKDGCCGDNLAIGWAKPGESTTAPSEIVPGDVLAPYFSVPKTSKIINQSNIQSNRVISICPNVLSEGDFKISLSGYKKSRNIEIMIFDMSGKKVYDNSAISFDSKGFASIKLSVGDIKQRGLFLVVVADGMSIQQRKFVIY